jgi:hypothetical protein
MKSSVKAATILLLVVSACTSDKSKTAEDSAAAAQANVDSATAAARTAVIPPGEKEIPVAQPAPVVPADEAPAGKWQVTFAGIGNLKAGMSLDEAGVVLGQPLASPAKLSDCDYVRPKSGPKHLAFMVEKGQIARVEVQEGSDIATTAGAKIGDTEQRIKTLYPNVEVRPSKYGSGHYLIASPKSGGNNRIVFETDGNKVVKYRAGRLPAVEYVEGCG